MYEKSGAAGAEMQAGTREVVIDGQSYCSAATSSSDRRKPVSRSEDLRKAIMGKKVGDEITIEAYRGDEKRSFDVKLGRQPAVSQD